jgi:phosphoadenosine phosphosulfate reductase
MSTITSTTSIPTIPTENLDLSTINEVFEHQSPEHVVKWAAAQFAPDLVMSSSFGAESAALIHMAIQ